eukprot:g3360.t1
MRKYQRRASFGIEIEELDSAMMQNYVVFARKMHVIVMSDWFNLLIIAVICFAGLLIGVGTYYPEPPPSWLQALDDIVLAIFCVEVVLKIMAEGTRPWRYWTGQEWRWNNFDFVIVVLCLPGIRDMFEGGAVALLRLARLMRVLKLVKKIPELHMIVMGLVGGFNSIAYILLLLFLIFYLYAIVGIMLFKSNDPWHFGSLETAMLTLFRMSTLEDWTDVMYINYFGCEQMVGFYGEYTMDANPAPDQSPCSATSNPTLSALYSITFILISALVMMSLFVGAITMSMSSALSDMSEQRKLQEAEKRKEKNLKAQLGGSNKEARSLRRSFTEMDMDKEALNKALSLVALRNAWKGKAEAPPADPTNPVALAYSQLAARAKVVAEAKWFENFITFIILLAGVMVGVQTNVARTDKGSTGFLDTMDWIIWFIFFVECAVKTIAERFKPWLYFYKKSKGGLQGWNTFDFIIVTMSFPLLGAALGVGSMVMILRLLRLLRVLKVLKAFPQLQVIVQALFKGMKSIGYIGVMLAVVYYIFAIVGIMLFKKNDPWHFGTLGHALLSLFRVATGEDWTDVMYINIFGCQSFGYSTNGMAPGCTSTKAWRWLSGVYFLVFVVIGALVMLTLFIGVVTTSMEESQDQQEREDKAAARVRAVAERCGISPAGLQIYRSVFDLMDVVGAGTVEAKDVFDALRSADYNVDSGQTDAAGMTPKEVVDDILERVCVRPLAQDEEDPNAHGLAITFPKFCRAMEEIKRVKVPKVPGGNRDSPWAFADESAGAEQPVAPSAPSEPEPVVQDLSNAPSEAAEETPNEATS